jgi:hypothetical protein
MAALYGKHFASMYTGSMCGVGTDVFAVWGYVIAHAVDGQVELNPKLMSAQLGAPEDCVRNAICFLCQPDPESRNPDEEGRRLVHQGAFLYRVVTHPHYRSMANSAEQREYNRVKQAESRERKKAKKAAEKRASKRVNTKVIDTNIDPASVCASGSASAKEGVQGEESDPWGLTPVPERPDDERVFEHWKERIWTKRSKREVEFTDQRKKRVRARLKKYSLEDLCLVIDRAAASEFHMGKNAGGKFYGDIDNIMGSDEKVDKWLASGAPTTTSNGRRISAIDQVQVEDE